MLTLHKTALPAWGRSSWFTRVLRQIVEAVDRLLIWYDRSRERRALLALDDHLLRDIGLNRADVWREGRKPFWRE
jgi:uncharacterized protein YjiS (DUF1127 family)